MRKQNEQKAVKVDTPYLNLAEGAAYLKIRKDALRDAATRRKVRSFRMGKSGLVFKTTWLDDLADKLAADTEPVPVGR